MASNTRIQRLKLGALCISVVLNAISANGVLVFPLMAPTLATHMKFSQSQLTSIVLAGMVGQYPLSPVIGKLVDKGPWRCSLIAAVLFSCAFSLAAWEFESTPADIVAPSTASFHRFVIYFGMIGMATAFSYFSAVFTASKNFPQYIGMAAGFSNVAFGMSPLFLTFIASTFFTSALSGLDVAAYLHTLALLCGAINVFGSFNLTLPPSDTFILPDTPDLMSSYRDLEESIPDENSSLIPKDDAEVYVVPVQEPEEGSIFDLICDPYFWVLFVALSCLLGSCEMVISNIGTILLSLPPSDNTSTKFITAAAPPAELAIAAQVRLLAISNTVCRLVVGPLADAFSPAACYLPDGTFCFTRKHHASRVLYISAGALLLAFSFIWMEIGVRSQSAVWLFSIGIGMVNGGVFNIIPGILSSIYGLRNLGRNFGVAAYAPFLGTPFFSFIYSYVAESHSRGGICEGIDCWRSTFWVNTCASFVAFLMSMLLWKQWRHRV